ncbi:MAG: hypothetical protein RLZZ361_607 [Cyanobacteriota bacterium]|jgi:HJR/Mrr/RecB family endonuclease
MVIDDIKRLINSFKKSNSPKISTRISSEPLFRIDSDFDNLVLKWSTPNKPSYLIDEFLTPFFTASSDLPKKYSISFFDFQKNFLLSSRALPEELAKIFNSSEDSTIEHRLIKSDNEDSTIEHRLIKSDNEDSAIEHRLISLENTACNEKVETVLDGNAEGVQAVSLLDSVPEFRSCLPSYQFVDGGFRVEVVNKGFEGIELKIEFNNIDIRDEIKTQGLFLKLEGNAGIYTILPFWIYQIYYSYKNNSKAWSFNNDLFIHALQKTRDWLEVIGSNDQLVLRDNRLNVSKIYTTSVDINIMKSLSYEDKYCVVPTCIELDEELNYSNEEEKNQAIQRGLANWDGDSSTLDFRSSSNKVVSLILDQKAKQAFTLLKKNYFNKTYDEVKESILCYSDESINNLHPEFYDFFNLDPNAYGKRVIGVGELLKMPGAGTLKSIYKSLLGEIDELPDSLLDLRISTPPEQKDINGNPAIALNIGSDQDTNQVIFLYQDELEAIKQEATKAFQTNKPLKILDRDTNKEITLSLEKKSEFDFFRKNLNQLIHHVNPPTPNTAEPKSHKQEAFHLQIKSNYDKTDYSEIEDSKTDRDLNLESNFSSYLDVLNLKPGIEAREHQIQGISWLVSCFLREYPGVIFADDMGLGKTFQAMCFIKILKSVLWQKRFLEPFTDPILIVVPQVLMKNFQEQANDFFTDPESFGFTIFHDSSKKKFLRTDIVPKFTQEYKSSEYFLDTAKLSEQKCIITTYDTLASFQKSFARVPWSLLLCDEVQKAKSCSSRISSSLKAIANKSTFKLFMSGTPIENDMREFWNLMDNTAPGLLGAFLDFKKSYPSFFKHCDSDLERNEDFSKLEKAIKFGDFEVGIVNGRLKEDIEDVKKDLSREDHNISFSLDQDILNRIEDIKNSKISTLDKIQKIKVLSIHKNLVDKIFEEDYKQWFSCDTRLQKLSDILKSIKEKNEKALIFCEYNQYQKIVQNMINTEFYDVNPGLLAINSKLDSRAREKNIQDFKSHEGFSALVLSPKCAGMGLNLQEANHIIHLSRWWNPAVEDQATCRAYRIGQRKKVQVYYFIADTEFERNLNDRLEEKRKMRKNLFSLSYNQDVLPVDLIPLKKNPISRLRHPSEFDVIKASNPKEQGTIFEDYIKELFEAHGYKVGKIPDDGIDWVLEKDGEQIGVQVKHTSNLFYSGTIRDIERFPTTLQRYKYKKGIFITNRQYPFNLKKIIDEINLTNNQVTIQWLNEQDLLELYHSVCE